MYYNEWLQVFWTWIWWRQQQQMLVGNGQEGCGSKDKEFKERHSSVQVSSEILSRNCGRWNYPK